MAGRRFDCFVDRWPAWNSLSGSDLLFEVVRGVAVACPSGCQGARCGLVAVNCCCASRIVRDV
jgi:hypothetical protein